MKPLHLIAALALPLMVASCHKPVAENSSDSPAPAPAAETTPAPVTVKATPVPATPAPVAAVPTPAGTPELAPPGVYYLLAATKIETADGIFGLPPGAGLKRIRPGTYLSSNGEVQLRDDQVTNDMALARKAKQQDEAVQIALKNRIAQEKAAAQAAAQRAAVAPPQSNTSANSAPPPSSGFSSTPRPSGGTSLDKQQYDNSRTILYDGHGKAYWKDSTGGRHYL